MGKPTGRKVFFIRGLRNGSDHYGNCEVCNRHMSQAFVGGYKKERLRENGELYYGGDDPDVYGHEHCVRAKFPEPVVIYFTLDETGTRCYTGDAITS